MIGSLLSPDISSRQETHAIELWFVRQKEQALYVTSKRMESTEKQDKPEYSKL